VEKVTREVQRELKRMCDFAIDDIIAKNAEVASIKAENKLLYQALHQASYAINSILSGRRRRAEVRASVKCKADAAADFANREMHLRARVRTARFQFSETLQQPRCILNPRRAARRR
jgi:hypothetical protein